MKGVAIQAEPKDNPYKKYYGILFLLILIVLMIYRE